MAITKVTLAKEHDDGVEYLYPKTSSDIVVHKNKQGDETNLNNFLSDINNIPGVLDIANGGTGATTGPNAIHNLTNGKIEVNENNKVAINANVNISGTTTSGEKLTVSNGGADINGKLAVTNGDIEATGNNIKGNTLQSINGTTVGNKLTVTNGGIEIKNNGGAIINGTTSINGNTTITGTTTSTNKITINNGGLEVKNSGGASINGKLTVTNGDIEATGSNIKGNTLQSINGTTVGNKLTVTAGGASINGSTTITGDTTIYGITNIEGTLNAKEDANFSKPVVMDKKLTISNGGAEINGDTVIHATEVNIDADTDITGSLVVDGGFTAASGETINTGNLILQDGNIQAVNGDIKGNTLQSVNGTTVGNKLTVSAGGAEIKGSTTVAGNITANNGSLYGINAFISKTESGTGGNITADNNITANAKVKGNTLEVTNNATIGGTATITGNTTINGGISVSNTINGPIPYGSCSNKANDTDKNVSITGYSLKMGARVIVKFTTDDTSNPATSPKLNVNSTGAKAIYYRGTTVSSSYFTKNRTYEFLYNGSQYELVGDLNTDTKVTSVGNHYTPSADTNSKIEVNASSSTAATWNSTSLVTGVNLQRDAKGHVTGMTVDSIKMPANPNTDTSTTLDGHYTPSANSNSKIEVDAKNATEAATWNVTNLVTGVNLQRDSKGHVTGMTLDSIKMPTNPNTHCTTHLYAGSGSAANATTTDGSTKLTIADNDTVRNSIILKGKGTTTVTSDDNGVITINSTGTQPAAQPSYSIDASGDSISPSGARIKFQKNNVDSSSVKIYGSGTSSVSKDDTGIKINTPLTINIDAYEKQEDEDGKDPVFDGIANTYPDNLSVFSSGVNYRTTFTFTGTSPTKKIYRKKYVNNKYVWQNVSDSSDTVAFASNNGSYTPLTNNTITITPNMLGTCLRGHTHGLASITENGFMSKGDKFILSKNIHQGRDLTLNNDGSTYKNAIGANSIVIGGTATNIATQTNSCAIGCSNTVKSCNSYVIGTNNNCGCERSFIFGDNSTITARSAGSVAIGCNSTVTGGFEKDCSPECVAIAGGNVNIQSAYVLTVPVYKKGTTTKYNNETATMAGHSLSYGMFSHTFSPYAVSFGTGCFAGDIGSFVCGMAPKTGYNSTGVYDSNEFSGISRRQTVYGLEANVDTNVFVVGNGSYVADEGANGTTHPVTYDETSHTYIHTFNHSNALRVTYRGGIYANGQYHSNGADYAEFVKEWWDGNPDNEDRVGYMVTIGEDNKLHKANEGDYIIGITSGNPSVIGNADEEYFWKYEKDRFNRIVMEETPVKIQEKQSDGSIVEKEIMISNKKFSANYDKDKPYIQRANRPEWDYVGMRGIVPCRDDGTCVARGFCKCGADGIATKADTRGFDTYYVVERIDDETISVEIK